MLHTLLQILRLPVHIVDTIIHLIRLIIKILASWWTLLGLIIWYYVVQQSGMCWEDHYQLMCQIVGTNAIWIGWGLFVIMKKQLPDIPPLAWVQALRNAKVDIPKPKKIQSARHILQSTCDSPNRRKVEAALPEPLRQLINKDNSKNV